MLKPQYAATVRRLVAAGYPKDKALLAVVSAWALSPEQVKRLANELNYQAAG